MKYTYFIFILFFLISCKNENSVSEISLPGLDDAKIESALKADSRFDFFQDIGYYALSPEFNTDKMINHYVSTNETFPDHEFINQYNLNMIDQIIDYLR